MSDFKMPIRQQDSNKGTFGKILNFSGSKNYIGAAYLSTLSALKTGAGYIALATEQNIIKTVSTMLPDAVYYAYSEALEKMKQFSVVLIGCGLGNTIKSRILFKKVVNSCKKFNLPIVIDADGLNILANIKKIELPPKTIITPHPVEASRLLDVTPDKILEDIEKSAKDLSKKYNCITVLKTHRTVVYNNETDELFINNNGNSALAKAGSGDVLAGIISGLVAQKMSLFEAAKLGVYLHSRTGEIASEFLTEYSVLASELPDYLPKAIKELI